MIAYLSIFSKSIFFLISFLFHIIFLGILWLTAPEVKPPKFTTIRTTIQFENKGVAKPSLGSLNQTSFSKKNTFYSNQTSTLSPFRNNRKNLRPSLQQNKNLFSQKRANRQRFTPIRKGDYNPNLRAKNQVVQQNGIVRKKETTKQQYKAKQKKQQNHQNTQNKIVQKKTEQQNNQNTQNKIVQKKTEQQKSKKITPTKSKFQALLQKKRARINYQISLAKLVASNWKVPQTSLKQFRIDMEALLDQNGNLLKIKLLKGSGVAALDAAAERAIRVAVPFPQFPQSFDQNQQFLAHFRFTPGKVHF
ncbi:MAG: TonB family protein [bacterium]|jgi:TonB family protein